MKTVAFFVRSIDPNGYPFNVRDLYFYSYQEYYLAIKATGLDVFFVSGNDSYEGNGVFREAWSINKISEVNEFTPAGRIKVDLVFNKAEFAGLDVPTVTDIRMHDILGDKIEMYKQFAAYQPFSVICNSPEELQAAVEAIPTTRVVVKLPKGNGGKFVYIYDDHDAVDDPTTFSYPLLVQEFMDMSAGAPGLADGIHDLRVLLTGNTIIGATLRQPAAGKLHANVSQGGSERLLSTAEIPQELQNIALDIDSKLPQYPRYYAADFAHTSAGWKLVELNKQPGLFRKDNGPLAQGFMEQFAEYIHRVA